MLKIIHYLNLMNKRQKIEVLATPSPSKPAHGPRALKSDKIRYLSPNNSDLISRTHVFHYLEGNIVYHATAKTTFIDGEINLARNHGAIIEAVLVNGKALGYAG